MSHWQLGLMMFGVKTTWVCDNVNEFGKNLWSEGNRNLGKENLTLQEFVSWLVRSQLDKFKLNQKCGINPDHG
jgi:hypothetical protein